MSFGKFSGDTILKLITVSILLALPGLFLEGGSPPKQRSITLLGDSTGAHYRFSPDQVTVSAGDTLLFRVESGGPHALGIDPTGLPRQVHEAWNRALPRRVGDLRGPLLRANQTYAVPIPAGTPAGRYVFFCLAHRAYDMRLEVDLK